jgi:DNA-binding NarL/FixJ family response regulator
MSTCPAIIRAAPDSQPNQYGTSRTRYGTYMAAVISAMLAQVCRRTTIHTAMPIDMFVAMTIAATSSRLTRVGWPCRTRRPSRDDALTRMGVTRREAEVLDLLAAGRTNRQIAEVLYISEKTASVHVTNLLRKLGVSNRIDAAAIAQRLGDDTG